ncbi:MAG TPA: hypothetical protein VGZ00_09120 [Candidatus Baltobacteraceae bacterium]|nr:hypothetical protein [Candidatus Baltobacteraceae bacterium]
MSQTPPPTPPAIHGIPLKPSVLRPLSDIIPDRTVTVVAQNPPIQDISPNLSQNDRIISTGLPLQGSILLEMYDRLVARNIRPLDITEFDYVGGVAVKPMGKRHGTFENLIVSAPNPDDGPRELPPEVDRRAVLQLLLKDGPKIIGMVPGVKSGAEITTVMVRLAIHCYGGIVYLVPVPPTEPEQRYDSLIIRENYSQFYVKAIQRKELRVKSMKISDDPSVKVEAFKGSNLQKRA